MERGRERRGELGCVGKGVFGEVSGEGGVERVVDGERSCIVCVFVCVYVIFCNVYVWWGENVYFV